MSLRQSGEIITGVNETVVDGTLTAIPNASANGSPLTGRPAGANGVIIYVPSGAGVTYTIATAQPGSAPSMTFALTDADRAWYEPLGPQTNIYVTAKTGSPVYRWM